jgi:hypothetical protein
MISWMRSLWLLQVFAAEIRMYETNLWLPDYAPRCTRPGLFVQLRWRVLEADASNWWVYILA